MRTSGRVVVLLGAGASCDAGLPAVSTLSRFLHSSLVTLNPALQGRDDVQLRRRREALQYVFERQPDARDNYELMFEVTLQLLDGQPRSAVHDALYSVPGAARSHIAHLLAIWPREDASYLLGLTAFGECVDVFTLNYDTLIEDACRRASVICTTGFDRLGRWEPDLLGSPGAQIRLHKLHGSLSWHEHDGLASEQIDAGLWTLNRPLVILGPRKFVEESIRSDERIGGEESTGQAVYRRLRECFLRRLFAAETCVVIGFGFGRTDAHVADSVDEFAERGGRVIEVNPLPCAPPRIRSTPGYRLIRAGARSVLDGLTAASLRTRR